MYVLLAQPLVCDEMVVFVDTTWAPFVVLLWPMLSLP